MTDCLFCRIVAGDVPTGLAYSDENLIAFDDINPQAPVHLLVVPRMHVSNAAELAAADPALVGGMVTVAHRLAGERSPAASGYRLIFNTGADAGQTVFHAHLHVVAGRRLGLGLA